MNIKYPADVLYWLWLQRRLGVDSRVILTVAETEGGAREIYESSSDELWATGRFSVKTINVLNDRSLDAEKRVLDRCAELGISLTVPGDVDYPGLLLSIPDPPAVIFYKGRLRELSRRPCIALVGTRKATEYGMQASSDLARRLAAAGMTVVSGCARGIDTAAHTGALEATDGGTISVLGCGIDYRYNMANEKLREAIAEKGALISEYPPGTDASPFRFPLRNRIISGLSLGTIVVEAAAGSGSLITARMAGEQGRDVFALTAGNGMSDYTGIHDLVSNCGAHPVRVPLDVLKHYISMYPMHLSVEDAERELATYVAPAPLPGPKAEDPMPTEHLDGNVVPAPEPLPEGISEEAKRLYGYLRLQPQLLDNIAEQAGLSVSEARIIMTELELFGCARTHPGNRHSL